MVLLSDGKISTEKIMKEQYKKNLGMLNDPDFLLHKTHEEYAVLDRAGRVQLGEAMLRQAGIDTKRVQVSQREGEIVIRRAGSEF